MTSPCSDSRRLLLAQLEALPDEVLAKLLDLIRLLGKGPEVHCESDKRPHLERFIGIWTDMPDEEFDEVLQLYRERSRFGMRTVDV